MKKLIIITLLTFSLSANAQFGDLLKGLEKIAKELDGSSQQPSDGSSQQPAQNTQEQQSQQKQQSKSAELPKVDKKQEFIDLMFTGAASLYLIKYTYNSMLPQMEFNTKYGGPPISADYKKLINSDIPARMKQLSDCSARGGGPAVNEESVKKWYQTSSHESAKDLKQSIEMMRMMMGGSDRILSPKVPTKKDLNLAPSNANDGRMIFNMGNLENAAGLGKDWCNKLLAEYNLTKK